MKYREVSLHRADPTTHRNVSPFTCRRFVLKHSKVQAFVGSLSHRMMQTHSTDITRSYGKKVRTSKFAGFANLRRFRETFEASWKKFVMTFTYTITVQLGLLSKWHCDTGSLDTMKIAHFVSKAEPILIRFRSQCEHLMTSRWRLEDST